VNVRLRRGGRLLPLLGPAVLAFAVASSLVVWTRIEITSLRYRLVELLDREGGLRGEVEKLRIEAAALGSLERIEGMARARGLTEPRPEQVVVLAEHGGSGEAQPDVGAPSAEGTR
jgi:cell division protein FtsL